ncbi:hypothetical protein KS083_26260 [Klebsiella pneumoniae subsp. ozaenae]|nr:hypothetical protein [Klebsiella pneumoniae subsp. ozaenae]
MYCGSTEHRGLQIEERYFPTRRSSDPIASVSFIYLLTLLRKAGHHPTPVAHA